MDKYELKLEMAKLKYNKKEDNKKGKYGKRIVTSIVLLVIFFTVGTFIVFWHTGSEPVVLVGTFFGFVTGELWMMKDIKKGKVKINKKTTEEITDDNSGINQGGE